MTMPSSVRIMPWYISTSKKQLVLRAMLHLSSRSNVPRMDVELGWQWWRNMLGRISGELNGNFKISMLDGVQERWQNHLKESKEFKRRTTQMRIEKENELHCHAQQVRDATSCDKIGRDKETSQDYVLLN